ncbi:hypothetical protein B0H65DRAFT_481302, partial [Neurospora tetraspora]
MLRCGKRCRNAGVSRSVFILSLTPSAAKAMSRASTLKVNSKLGFDILVIWEHTRRGRKVVELAVLFWVITTKFQAAGGILNRRCQ